MSNNQTQGTSQKGLLALYLSNLCQKKILRRSTHLSVEESKVWGLLARKEEHKENVGEASGFR